MKYHVLALALLTCLLSPLVHADPPAPAKRNPAAIAAQVGSPVASVQEEGLLAIKMAVAENSHDLLSEFRPHYAPALLKAQRFAELDAYCVTLIAQYAGNVEAIESLQNFRVQALLGQERYPEALAQAKASFNLSRMSRTSEALALVAQCLNPSYTKDRQIGPRFRAQQLAAAESPTSAIPEALGKSVMAQIQVPADTYDEALKKLTKDDFTTLCARGNLLLLMDRTSEARAEFDSAYTLASDRDLLTATENLARGLKAQDGAIGRANAFVLSIRPTTPPKKTGS